MFDFVMNDSFAKLLGFQRERRHKSRPQLAKALGISASHMHYLETGKRRPSRDLIDSISAALRLSPTVAAELIASAGYHPEITSRLDDAVRPIRAALSASDISEGDASGLIRDIQLVVMRWNRHRGRGEGHVTKAVMVSAGWQPRLLNPSRFEETLIHAAQEVSKAGIDDLIVVVAPDAPSFE